MENPGGEGGQIALSLGRWRYFRPFAGVSAPYPRISNIRAGFFAGRRAFIVIKMCKRLTFEIYGRADLTAA